MGTEGRAVHVAFTQILWMNPPVVVHGINPRQCSFK